jgi:hypothetical protein
MRADYRRTIEIIHRRYRAHAEPIPGVVEAQRRFLAALAEPPEPVRFDYSVIMPVWNRCQLTRQCIEALARVPNDVRFELIVIDNGSTDDTGVFRFFERWGARWWLVDEDAVYVARGHAARMFEREGKRYINFVPLTDAPERHRWELVAGVQRAAQRRDLDVVRALLARVEDWPDDPDVREWAAGVCRQVGMAEHTRPSGKRLGASAGAPAPVSRETGLSTG